MIKMNINNCLPREIVAYILQYIVHPDDVACGFRVCRLWYEIITVNNNYYLAMHHLETVCRTMPMLWIFTAHAQCMNNLQRKILAKSYDQISMCLQDIYSDSYSITKRFGGVDLRPYHAKYKFSVSETQVLFYHDCYHRHAFDSTMFIIGSNPDLAGINKTLTHRSTACIELAKLGIGELSLEIYTLLCHMWCILQRSY